ncbi:hypothetical protein ABIA24_003297 [Sinorhizobium fredii]
MFAGCSHSGGNERKPIKAIDSRMLAAERPSAASFGGAWPVGDVPHTTVSC